MSTNIPYPNLKDGDDFSVTPLMANILALLLAVQSFDGSQVQAGTIPAAALATDLNPLARDYDMFQSFVASGLLPSGFTGLTLTIPNGVAYVNYNSALTKYAISGGSYTVSTSKDTYFSLNNAGVVDTPISLANNAALPSLATGSQFLFRAVSDGTGITRIDDLRATQPNQRPAIQFLGKGGAALNPIPTSYTDVSSSSQTFTVTRPSILLASFNATDLQTNGNALAQVALNVDGTNQTDVIAQKLLGASGGWELHNAPAVNLPPISLAAGVHTIKLQATSNATGATALNGASWHGIVVGI